MLILSPFHLKGSPSQVQYTLVPLVFRALGLARTIRAAELDEDERAAAAAQAAQAAAAAAQAAAEAAESTSEATKGEKEDAALEGGSAEGRMNGKEEGGEVVAKGSMSNGGDEGATSSALVVKEGGATTAEAASGGGQGEALVVVPPPVRPRQFSSRKAYQFLHEIVTAMAPLHPWVSLTLFLQCALGADHTGFKAIAYEFFSQVGRGYKSCCCFVCCDLLS